MLKWIDKGMSVVQQCVKQAILISNPTKPVRKSFTTVAGPETSRNNRLDSLLSVASAYCTPAHCVVLWTAIGPHTFRWALRLRSLVLPRFSVGRFRPGEHPSPCRSRSLCKHGFRQQEHFWQRGRDEQSETEIKTHHSKSESQGGIMMYCKQVTSYFTTGHRPSVDCIIGGSSALIGSRPRTTEWPSLLSATTV